MSVSFLFSDLSSVITWASSLKREGGRRERGGREGGEGREGREGGSICTCTLLSLFLFTFHDEMNPHQSSQNSLELEKQVHKNVT